MIILATFRLLFYQSQVIGPEDLLEDSPPPPEVEKIGEIEEKTGEVEEIEVVESVIEVAFTFTSFPK